MLTVKDLASDTIVTGTFNNQPAWSDGSALFVGDVPSNLRRCRISKDVDLTRLEHTLALHNYIPVTSWSVVKMLNLSWPIIEARAKGRQAYIKYAYFIATPPNTIWYIAGKTEALIAKRAGDIVAAIMPLSLFKEDIHDPL